ncbi:NACHT domain-containing protein [Aeromicrobium sp. 179-A 4D2 NHS]|uniref:NACHT domain-containing protein n=1 Tax=Aeromicrobium sp. 179-A 4D2 NHS TaxID=3142375 RepID=UPI0039A28D24
MLIGEEAHIRSGRVNGPRHDPDYPESQIDSYENLILLCGTHHTVVDKQDGRAFSVAELEQMKARHEDGGAARDRLVGLMREYVADRFLADDRIQFEQVDLSGPTVDSMFVDVPFAAHVDAPAGQLLDTLLFGEVDESSAADRDEYVQIGAAQAILHPNWTGNALLVGGPGQGKSTVLQYVCQYHRALLLNDPRYRLEVESLRRSTAAARMPFRIDLRAYAGWIRQRIERAERKSKRPKLQLEVFIAEEVSAHTATRFSVEDFLSTVASSPVLVALDGLDEVANLKDRDLVASEILAAAARLAANANDLSLLVASRPGATSAGIWSADNFPQFFFRPLTPGLKYLYLEKWSRHAGLDRHRASRLKSLLGENEDVPHIRELSSNPMQLAILLHLLYRRGLLPQQRTDLYVDYVQTFFDRESEGKEPLADSERRTIEDVHAFLGWHIQSRSEAGLSTGSISREDISVLLEEFLSGREGGPELAGRLFDALTSRVICLVERRKGFFEFEVQSLQEYFAARHIFDNAPSRGVGNTKDDCVEALMQRPYWFNVLRFFAGMLSKGEVKSLVTTLEMLQALPDLKAHPMLRWVAVQLLDDRVFQAQGSAVIQRVVDFALDGPGLLLAEDGFLNGTRTPAVFSEGAGRRQAAEHARLRLQSACGRHFRRAAAGILLRHESQDQIHAWWWSDEQRTVSADWMKSAADLRVLEGLDATQEEHLEKCAQLLDGEPLSEVLLRGSYDGASDVLIETCRAEIADGVADSLVVEIDAGRTTLGLLLSAGLETHPLSRAFENGRSASVVEKRLRRRVRNRPGRAEARHLIATLNSFPSRTSDWTSSQVWLNALDVLCRAWGDSWLLRMSCVAWPVDVPSRAVARPSITSDAPITHLVAWTSAAREHRADPAWWSEGFERSSSTLEARHWLLGLLVFAHTNVIVDVLPAMEAHVASLSDEQLASLQMFLWHHLRTPTARRINPSESIRLGRFKPSGKSSVLLQNIVTEGARDDLAKFLLADINAVLRPKGRITRHLQNTVTRSESINVEGFVGLRSSLPRTWSLGGVLTGMTKSKSRDILSNPDRWPTAIVYEAVSRLDNDRTDILPLLDQASSDNWVV